MARQGEIHCHFFQSEASFRGMPDPLTGMVADFGLLQHAIEDVRLTLDLNKIEALGTPTLKTSRVSSGNALRISAG